MQLAYFSRYHGLLGERFLPFCKPNQVMVSIAHSSLFDEAALAEVLASGRMAAAWFDSLEPGALDPGRPLHDIDTLQITPRVASTTRESRIRSAWAVARRIDELLTGHAGPRAASSRRRRQTTRLILQPAKRLREVGQALLLLIDHRRRRARDEALVAQLGARPWRSRPRRRAISLLQARAARPATSISTCSARRAVADHRHRRVRVAAANAASSSKRRTSDSLASALSSGAAWSTKAASPMA